MSKSGLLMQGIFQSSKSWRILNPIDLEGMDLTHIVNSWIHREALRWNLGEGYMAMASTKK